VTPYVDVVCGGFPCPDLSTLGTGLGLAGARSGLWFEYLRVIRELRPSYVIVENVPALRTRGLGAILGGLAACGYDAEWDGVSAAAFGAPHPRDRIWLIAYPNGDVVREQPGRGIGANRQGPALTAFDGPTRLVADPQGIQERGADDEADALAAGGQAWPLPLGGSERGGEEVQTSMDVGRPCAGCGSFGAHLRNCYLGDSSE
jgi:site-specific DNA-cytosine methylase